MEVIQTYYKGYHFRSRLEARWAVFFDALGVQYEYEPEGYKLRNGMYYLPDFRVKCWGLRGEHSGPPFDLYIEVKGFMTEEDARKITSFANLASDGYDAQNPVLIVDKIPAHGTACDSWVFGSYDDIGSGMYAFNYSTVDGDYFAAYPAATIDGKFYLMGDDCNYINQEDIDRVIRAYDCARMARFEHGETPQI